jgi:hypothetical protein
MLSKKNMVRVLFGFISERTKKSRNSYKEVQGTFDAVVVDDGAGCRR